MSEESDGELGEYEYPRIETPIPGPRSIEAVDDLGRTECPAITARRARRAEETGIARDPIVWRRARGANVEDVDGNIYIDMTAAFAVSGLGHAHSSIVEAGTRQLHRLPHAMGDVYPADAKIEFSRKLADRTPGDLQQSILGMSGSDAVQAALKTAVVHTGKTGILAFWGGYHGLEYGALDATAYRDAFREPFLDQLGIDVHHVPYPDPYRRPSIAAEVPPGAVGERILDHIDESLGHPASGLEEIGAVIVEPILGRGGKVVPPEGFLSGLRALTERRDILLIVDEIYTGFGRTGRLFECNREGVVPDLLCLGKGMGGGFPISACIGRESVMRSWELSRGEAIHTSTFLGNPVGCAMAGAFVDELDEKWLRRIRAASEAIEGHLEGLREDFSGLVGETRGRGLMWGIELVEPEADSRSPNSEGARRVMDFCRERGYLVLPSGVYGNVIGLTPPFCVSDTQLEGFMEVLRGGFESLLS